MADSNKTVSEEEVLAKLNQLGFVFPEDIPFQWETMFAKINGWGAKAYIKKKHKLIQACAPALRKALKPGERVLYVGKGVYNSLVEQYFMGALLAQMLNQTVFVLTNLRLVMMHSNSKGVPSTNYWTIYYNQIVQFKGSWTGTVKLKLADGKSYTFSGFLKLDRKQMPMVFEKALELYRELGFDPTVTQSRENLCSHCFEVVPKKQFSCDHCGSTFYKPSEVALRSLLFPSLGDWIMGHHWAAFFELLGYLIGWAFIVARFQQALQVGGDAVTEATVNLVLFILFAHVMDAILTAYVARKGLYLKKPPRPT